MSISQLARSIAESPTLRLNEEARLLRERGEPVIHLGIGEPKNKTPIGAILQRGGEAEPRATSSTRPTDGTPVAEEGDHPLHRGELRQGRRAGERHRLGRRQAGALQPPLHAPQSAGRGRSSSRRTGSATPRWSRWCYGVPVIVTPEDGSFHPADGRTSSGRSARTPRRIIVNSPNNPSGVVYPRGVHRARSSSSARRKRHLPDHGRHLPQAGLRRRTAPLLPTGSPTKDIESSQRHRRQRHLEAVRHDRLPHRLGGRAAELVEVMTNVQAQTTSCASPVLQAAAEGALTGLQSVVESLRLTIENNRDVMMQELPSFNGVQDRQAATARSTACPTSAPTAATRWSSRNFLLKKALVVTVPGQGVRHGGPPAPELLPARSRTSPRASRASSGRSIPTSPERDLHRRHASS